MTYFEDLSTKCMVVTGDRVRAVGWLDADHDFTTGPVPASFVEALRSQLEGCLWAPFAFAGVHECELCSTAQPFIAAYNLIVPAADVLYVAPEMIGHYIAAHGYRPPDAFMRAVEGCPPQSSRPYMELLRPYLVLFPRMPSDPESVIESAVRMYEAWPKTVQRASTPWPAHLAPIRSRT